MDLKELLGDLDEVVKTEVGSTPEVAEAPVDLDVGGLPITARRWHRISDAVAVVGDLKNSTRLGVGKWAASTASIYQASTGGIAEVLDSFDADFLAIQGDGAFALFWGASRYERALCAGITIKTFSLGMVERLEKRWPDALPETGFKVGIASGSLLVKRVGTPRNPAQQEPVWAGRSVNYAAKAAQGADRHEMVVTGSVWDVAEKNDFLAFSCPCGTGPSSSIWSNAVVGGLPDSDPEAQGRVLTSSWCDVHGAEYCSAILEGRRKRDDLEGLRGALQVSQMRDAVRAKARSDRALYVARRRGLAS